MNIPPNTRPFDLSMAQQGHPLVTRAGATAKFIAYVPVNDELYKLVTSVDGQIVASAVDGRFAKSGYSDKDLFLAPLGYCEGLPVFAGDVLDWRGEAYIVDVTRTDFTGFKWPSKIPVVETRMGEDEIMSVYDQLNSVTFKEAILGVANKAIERSIADGDCLPMASFVELASQAFNNHYLNGNYSFEDHAESVLNEYLENLK